MLAKFFFVVFFAFLWTETKSKSMKTQKRETNIHQARWYISCGKKNTKEFNFIISCSGNSSTSWFSLFHLLHWKLSAVLFSHIHRWQELWAIFFFLQNIRLPKLQTKILMSRLQRKFFKQEHSGQLNSILLTRVANQSAGFGTSCPLAHPAI